MSFYGDRMPRPLRIEYEGAYYHVMNRGRGRRTIFHGDAYRYAFLDTLSEAHRRFGVDIHAYCLMGNHYHLLLETPRANLSRAMRHINGLYTQRYNRLARTDGPLFRGRFKAVLVDRDNYLVRLGRYIHRNPIETDRPLVMHLEDYSWSSYPAYINKARAPEWLEREQTYAMLGQRRRYAGYRRYVESGGDRELEQFYGRGRWAAILGDERFVQEASGREWRNGSASVLRRRLYEPPDFDRIVDAVCDAFTVDRASVVAGKRGRRNEARWAAMYLCQQLGGMSLAALAERFRLEHISGVNHQVGQLKRCVETDKKMREKIQLLIQDLTPLA